MSITQHPLWPDLQPWIHIEHYGRDTGPHGARIRIEVARPPDGWQLRTFLALTMPCVVCGRLIHPIRERQTPRPTLYYAATCPLDVTFTCARRPEARDEYLRIRQVMTAWQVPQQQLSLL